MGGEVIILTIIFGAIFGVFYLHYSTRNKERLALIEKGIDAGIFKQSQEAPPVWKVLILNLALLMMGIGLGITIAYTITESMGLSDGPLYPAIIFLTAGASLLLGFFMTKKYIK